MKIILNENYVNYEAALEMTGLESLESRRERRCLEFSLKCASHDRNNRLFPLNPVGQKEKFLVNFARTETYRQSAIPYCQRLLNDHFNK